MKASTVVALVFLLSFAPTIANAADVVQPDAPNPMGKATPPDMLIAGMGQDALIVEDGKVIKRASSPEFVGEFWLGEVSKLVI